MTHKQAIATLRWHAENSTSGRLADSCKHDAEWEDAYRIVFGVAPTYTELMGKLEGAKESHGTPQVQELGQRPPLGQDVR